MTLLSLGLQNPPPTCRATTASPMPDTNLTGYADPTPVRYTVQNVPTATPPTQSQIVSGKQLGNTINFTDLSTLPQPKQIMSTHSDLGLNVSQSLKENRAKLANIDIKSAFRLLMVNPADFDLLGITFCNIYYIDKCLPIYLKQFSTLLQWVVEVRSGLDSLDNYLDDFIFIGGEQTSDCSVLMETFMGLCNELGVPLAKNKTVGPTNILPFLGYIIDTELMMVLIPFEKIKKMSRLLQSLLVRKKINLSR